VIESSLDLVSGDRGVFFIQRMQSCASIIISNFGEEFKVLPAERAL
jgi:hypothetical protein